MNMTTHELEFATQFNRMAVIVNAIATEKGWWDEPRELGTILALVHAEVSEALEVARVDLYTKSDVVTEGAFAEELADIVIRVMDLATEHGIDLGRSIVEKSRYNEGRPHKHGRRF